MITTLVDNHNAYDVFICHASEDKEVFVRPLANMLIDLGIKVWYDEFSLQIGDSLRRAIERGLSNSRYGIVVLSKNFFRKEWPQKELDGLMSKEASAGKTILPIWHGVNQHDVECFSLILASKVAISSDKGLSAVVSAICDVVYETTAAYKGHIKTMTLSLQSFKKDALSFVNSDMFANIVISSLPALIECIANVGTKCTTNAYLDAFTEWRDIDYRVPKHAPQHAPRWRGLLYRLLDRVYSHLNENGVIDSVGRFSPDIMPWVKEIGSHINSTFNELCDKYGLPKGIIVVPLTIGWHDIVDEEALFADKEGEAFFEGYFYYLLPHYSERVADRIAKLVEVRIDIVTAIVSGTIFIVLIWAGIFWLSGTTGILIQLIAVALGGSSIVFIVKDKRSRIGKWENTPVWVRGVLVPEQKYAGLVRTFTKEMEKRLHSFFGLKFRTKRHVDKVIKGLRDAINRSLVDIG